MAISLFDIMKVKFPKFTNFSSKSNVTDYELTAFKNSNKILFSLIALSQVPSNNIKRKILSLKYGCDEIHFILNHKNDQWFIYIKIKSKTRNNSFFTRNSFLIGMPLVKMPK
jgi:hypothetical protein